MRDECAAAAMPAFEPPAIVRTSPNELTPASGDEQLWLSIYQLTPLRLYSLRLLSPLLTNPRVLFSFSQSAYHLKCKVQSQSLSLSPLLYVSDHSFPRTTVSKISMYSISVIYRRVLSPVERYWFIDFLSVVYGLMLWRHTFFFFHMGYYFQCVFVDFQVIVV